MLGTFYNYYNECIRLFRVHTCNIKLSYLYTWFACTDMMCNKVICIWITAVKEIEGLEAEKSQMILANPSK